MKKSIRKITPGLSEDISESVKRVTGSLNRYEVEDLDMSKFEKICFKLIEPVSADEVADALGIEVNLIEDRDDRDKARSTIVQGVFTINRYCSRIYQDRDFRQSVNSYSKPWKKFLTPFFRDRMTYSREECIKGLLQEKASTFRVPRPFYKITEEQYKKAMEEVESRRKIISEGVVAYYDGVMEKNPTLIADTKADAKAIEAMTKAINAADPEMSVAEIKGERLNPSVKIMDPDHVSSVFSDKEKGRKYREFQASVKASTQVA